MFYSEGFLFLAKTNIIENLFPYIAVYSSFLPIALFALNWKKCKDSRPLWVIILYAFFVDFLINYAVDFVPHSPVKRTLYASYTFFEFLAFAYFLFLHIKKKQFRDLITFASLGFLIFIVAYNLIVKYKFIDSIPIGVETILIMIFAFYYLYEELKDSSTLFIYSKPVFWIIFGIVIYLAGNFFIYIFAESLKRHEVQQYWYITNIFTIIKNIFFSIAILLHTKSPKQKHNYDIDLSSLN